MKSKNLDDAKLSKKQSAAYIGKSQRTLNSWRPTNKHNLKFVKEPNGHIKYFQSSLDAYLSEPLKP